MIHFEPPYVYLIAFFLFFLGAGVSLGQVFSEAGKDVATAAPGRWIVGLLLCLFACAAILGLMGQVKMATSLAGG